MERRTVAAPAEPAGEHMRYELLPSRLSIRGRRGRGKVLLHAVQDYETDTFELHLTVEQNGKPTIVEAVDLTYLASTWAQSVLDDSGPPARTVIGFATHRADCACGHAHSIHAKTALYGNPAGEISLGCPKCMSAEELIHKLHDHVWNR